MDKFYGGSYGFGSGWWCSILYLCSMIDVRNYMDMILSCISIDLILSCGR